MVIESGVDGQCVEARASGEGSAVPVIVVFLGVIGGFVAMGVIGLFIGAIVPSVGYNLSLAWIEGGITQSRE